MECQEIMHPVETHLYADDPAAKIIDFMQEKHTGLAPVIDRDGLFVGMISGDRLVHFLLPRPISMMRGARNASYFRESREELRERLHSLRAHTIMDLVDTHVTVAHPDTGLIDAMLILSDRQHVVPIVERGSNKLLGAISFFTILNALEGDSP